MRVNIYRLLKPLDRVISHWHKVEVKHNMTCIWISLEGSFKKVTVSILLYLFYCNVLCRCLILATVLINPWPHDPMTFYKVLILTVLLHCSIHQRNLVASTGCPRNQSRVFCKHQHINLMWITIYRNCQWGHRPYCCCYLPFCRSSLPGFCGLNIQFWGSEKWYFAYRLSWNPSSMVKYCSCSTCSSNISEDVFPHPPMLEVPSGYYYEILVAKQRDHLYLELIPP